MSPGDLEQVLTGLTVQCDDRIITNMKHCEDAAIVRFPVGQNLVQTLDFFTPNVNDPFRFGQIAAANSLSDVYAMGGIPYVVMNIVCFPAKTMNPEILTEILQGGLSKIHEAGAMLVGGHTVQDCELKYGLSVSGCINPHHYASNTGLSVGDMLLLTKPIGSGVLATAIKAEWVGSDLFEKELHHWAAHLNKIPGEAIQRFLIRGATDVTGFGLGGHLIEMADGSNCCIELDLSAVPIMQHVYELGTLGLFPEGCHFNKQFCANALHVRSGCDPISVDLVFDAQTSGGLVLAVSPAKINEVQSWLLDHGELAVIIGHVQPCNSEKYRLIL